MTELTPYQYSNNKSLRENTFLSTVGQCVSFIFHPLFVPAYITLYLLYVDPYFFASVNERYKLRVFLSIFVTTGVMPAIVVALLKALGFIDSIYLRTQRDRIIPITVTMIFYFSTYYVYKKDPGIPHLFTQFLLATFITSIIAQMANIKFKISLHALAMGCAMTFFILLAFTGNIPMGIYLSIVTFIAGLVCTARLITGSHNSFEVYAGFAGGILAMLIASWF